MALVNRMEKREDSFFFSSVGFLVCFFLFVFVLTIQKGQEMLYLHPLTLIMSFVSVSAFLPGDSGHHQPFPTGTFLSLQNTYNYML